MLGLLLVSLLVASSHAVAGACPEVPLLPGKNLVCSLRGSNVTFDPCLCSHLVADPTVFNGSQVAELKSKNSDLQVLALVNSSSQIPPGFDGVAVQGASAEAAKVLEAFSGLRAWIPSTRPEELLKQDLAPAARLSDLVIVSSDTFQFSGPGRRHPGKLSDMRSLDNLDSKLDLLLGGGVPHSKLVLTMPAYGLKGKADSEPEVPEILGRAEVCVTNWTIDRNEDLTEPTKHEGVQWLGYDDITSLRVKARYILLRGLRGAGLWWADQDADCNGDGGLLKSLRSVLAGQDLPTERDHLSGITLPGAGPVSYEVKEVPADSPCRQQAGYVRSDCQGHFVRCVPVEEGNSVVFTYTCSRGLVFDERTRLCTWPAWTEGCKPKESEELYECTAEGYFSDPADCTGYHYCKDYGDGVLRSAQFRCPSGLLGFNQTGLQCTWRWLLPECSGKQISRQKRSVEEDYKNDPQTDEQMPSSNDKELEIKESEQKNDENISKKNVAIESRKDVDDLNGTDTTQQLTLSRPGQPLAAFIQSGQPRGDSGSESIASAAYTEEELRRHGGYYKGSPRVNRVSYGGGYISLPFSNSRPVVLPPERPITTMPTPRPTFAPAPRIPQPSYNPPKLIVVAPPLLKQNVVPVKRTGQENISPPALQIVDEKVPAETVVEEPIPPAPIPPTPRPSGQRTNAHWRPPAPRATFRPITVPPTSPPTFRPVTAPPPRPTFRPITAPPTTPPPTTTTTQAPGYLISSTHLRPNIPDIPRAAAPTTVREVRPEDWSDEDWRRHDGHFKGTPGTNRQSFGGGFVSPALAAQLQADIERVPVREPRPSLNVKSVVEYDSNPDVPVIQIQSVADHGQSGRRRTNNASRRPTVEITRNHLVGVQVDNLQAHKERDQQETIRAIEEANRLQSGNINSQNRVEQGIIRAVVEANRQQYENSRNNAGRYHGRIQQGSVRQQSGNSLNSQGRIEQTTLRGPSRQQEEDLRVRVEQGTVNAREEANRQQSGNARENSRYSQEGIQQNSLRSGSGMNQNHQSRGIASHFQQEGIQQSNYEGGNIQNQYTFGGRNTNQGRASSHQGGQQGYMTVSQQSQEERSRNQVPQYRQRQRIRTSQVYGNQLQNSPGALRMNTQEETTEQNHQGIKHSSNGQNSYSQSSLGNNQQSSEYQNMNQQSRSQSSSSQQSQSSHSQQSSRHQSSFSSGSYSSFKNEQGSSAQSGQGERSSFRNTNNNGAIASQDIVVNTQVPIQDLSTPSNYGNIVTYVGENKRRNANAGDQLLISSFYDINSKVQDQGNNQGFGLQSNTGNQDNSRYQVYQKEHVVEKVITSGNEAATQGPRRSIVNINDQASTGRSADRNYRQFVHRQNQNGQEASRRQASSSQHFHTDEGKCALLSTPPRTYEEFIGRVKALNMYDVLEATAPLIKHRLQSKDSNQYKSYIEEFLRQTESMSHKDPEDKTLQALKAGVVEGMGGTSGLSQHYSINHQSTFTESSSTGPLSPTDLSKRSLRTDTPRENLSHEPQKPLFFHRIYAASGIDSIPEVTCSRPGLFPQPGTCGKFYECYWDKWLNRFTLHLYECPVTLAFDGSLPGCVGVTPCQPA